MSAATLLLIVNITERERKRRRKKNLQCYSTRGTARSASNTLNQMYKNTFNMYNSHFVSVQTHSSMELHRQTMVIVYLHAKRLSYGKWNVTSVAPPPRWIGKGRDTAHVQSTPQGASLSLSLALSSSLSLPSTTKEITRRLLRLPSYQPLYTTWQPLA